jgi:hypothetical protein
MDAEGNRFRYVYNLTALIRQVGETDYTYVQSGFHFEINFCANTLNNPNCYFFTPAWMSLVGGTCNSFGSLEDMTYEPMDAATPENGIKLTYNNKVTGCSLNLMVECNPSETAEYGAVITGVEPYQSGQDACISTVYFSSPWGCPEEFGGPTGLSPGSIILIILACLVFVYIAGLFHVSFWPSPIFFFKKG